MRTIRRCAAPCLAALTLVLLAATAACAQAQWPNLVAYTLSLSSDETGRYQTSLAFSGPVGEYKSLKVQGWWIAGTGKDRAFVGDAYLDFDRDPVYAAAGRKFTMFGPAGVLVSPGFLGGELRLRAERLTFQAIAGTLQFTPGTGTTRFTYAGYRAPSDEHVTAVRVAGELTEPGAAVPVTLGANWTDVADNTGSSLDASIDVNKWLTLYGEAAHCEGDAHVYGIRLSDGKLRSDGRTTIFVLYHRDIEVGFVPATVGSSAYFEGQTGWAWGIYSQSDPRHAVGVFTDGENASLTWFGNAPL